MSTQQNSVKRKPFNESPINFVLDLWLLLYAFSLILASSTYIIFFVFDIGELTFTNVISEGFSLLLSVVFILLPLAMGAIYVLKCKVLQKSLLYVGFIELLFTLLGICLLSIRYGIYETCLYQILPILPIMYASRFTFICLIIAPIKILLNSKKRKCNGLIPHKSRLPQLSFYASLLSIFLCFSFLISYKWIVNQYISKIPKPVQHCVLKLFSDRRSIRADGAFDLYSLCRRYGNNEDLKPAVPFLMQIMFDQDFSYPIALRILSENDKEDYNEGYPLSEAKRALKCLCDAKSLIPYLRHHSYIMRAGVIRLLGEMNDTSVVEPLIHLLDDRHYFVREQAVESIGKIGTHDAISALMIIMKNDSFASVKLKAVDVLLKLSDEQADKVIKSTLLKMIQRKPFYRNQAINYLGELHDTGCTNLLLTMLNDKDMDTRCVVVSALGWKGNRMAIDSLMQLVKSKSKELRMAAIQAIGSIGDTSSINEMLKLAYHGDASTLSMAIYATGMIGGVYAANHLQELQQFLMKADTTLTTDDRLRLLKDIRDAFYQIDEKQSY